MIKEDFDAEVYEYAKSRNGTEDSRMTDRMLAYRAGAEPREKRIAELEEKISVLLFCKNCPENKGGFICVKEYENKCLAQKIQYIKELKEENKLLTQNLEDTEILNETLVNRNAELKELLKQWLQTSKASGCDNINIVTDTEQFLSEVEE